MCRPAKKDIQEPLIDKKHKKVKRKINLHTTDRLDDPLMVMGYGIIAYRDILLYMFYAFLGITVMQVPSLHIYSQGTAYLNQGSSEDYSIGNLGYSSVQCDQIPVGIGIL